MCDPATIGASIVATTGGSIAAGTAGTLILPTFSTFAASTVGTALSTAFTLAGGLSSIANVVSGLGESRAQAGGFENQARRLEIENQLSEQERRIRSRRRLGRARAIAGSSGLDVNSSSFTDIFASDARLDAFETFNENISTQFQATDLRQSATNIRQVGRTKAFGGIVDGVLKFKDGLE